MATARKTKGRETATSGFLFVNKSERSKHLSRSGGHERAHIQRHVQTGRPRTRVCKNTNITSTCDVPASGGSKSNVVSVPATVQLSSSDGCKAPLSLVDPHSPITRSVRRSLSNNSQYFHETYWCEASLVWQRMLCGQDPFGATSIPIEEPVAGLLHYYIYYHHPSQWPNEMALLRHGVYMFEDALLEIMKAAIEDELTMYCLLSSAACRIQFIDKLPCATVIGMEKRYILKALQTMNSQIVTGGFQQPEKVTHLLSCIMFLNSAESYRGDLIAAKTHLAAAVKLLELVGGIASIQNENLLGRFAMADLFLSCVNLEPCSFDCWYDPGPAGLLQLRDCELRSSDGISEGRSFLERSEYVITAGMTTVIEDLIESHNVKSRIIASSMSNSRAKQVLHWITMRNMAIRHKLLALDLMDSRSHALRVTIIMWSLLAMNITGRAKTVKLMASKLQEILLTISTTEWDSYQDIKLWIALVGSYCAIEDSHEATWFMVQSATLATQLIPSFSADAASHDLARQLENFQYAFFFDIEAQRARTQILLEMLRCVST